MIKFWPAFYKISLVLLAIAIALIAAVISNYYSPYLLIALLIFSILCLVILHDPLRGVYLLVFFLPFERIGSYDFLGMTIRISQAIAVLTIIAWVFRGLNLKKFKLRPVPIFWPSIVFLLIAAIALVNSPNIERSLKVLIFTIFTISISWLLPNIIRHGKQMPRIMNILLVSCAIVTIFGLYQFCGDIIGLSPGLTGLRPQYTKDILGFPRIQSTALEPLYFANYLLIPLCIFLSLFFSKSQKIKYPLLIGIIILGGINLILTVARGGYIAFAASLLVLVFIYFNKLFHLKNIFYLLFAGILIYVGANYFLNFNLEGAKDKFLTHTENIFVGASYFERVDTMGKAYSAWLTHPFIGIGSGSFGPYVAAYPFEEPAEGYLIVNNEYIELLAETGIFGLILFIIIIAIIIIRSIKAIKLCKDSFIRALLIGLLAAFVGILVQYNTFSILYIMHVWVTIGFLIVVQNIVLLDKYNE